MREEWFGAVKLLITAEISHGRDGAPISMRVRYSVQYSASGRGLGVGCDFEFVTVRTAGSCRCSSHFVPLSFVFLLSVRETSARTWRRMWSGGPNRRRTGGFEHCGGEVLGVRCGEHVLTLGILSGALGGCRGPRGHRMA